MVALWSRHWNRHHGQKSKSLRSVSQSIMSSMTVVWFRRVSHVAINQDYGKGDGEVRGHQYRRVNYVWVHGVREITAKQL